MPPKKSSKSRESEIFTEITKSSKKSEILNDLKELHDELSTLSQDPTERPKGLPKTAAYLVSDKIIGHTDKEVRLLAACCLVDILRVFAPEAPYNDTELIKVFQCIVAQIRGFATHDSNTSTGTKIFYIVNSLSVVKSCVVMVFLAQSGLAGAEELYISLFDSIVSSIRSDHSEEVMTHMVSILQACIEESECIEQELLDILLVPLLPAQKADNLAAYNLCFTVLRRTTVAIQTPISTFINNHLVGSGMTSDKSSSEVLTDDVYPLIFELHKISPGLLLRILPNICIQLHVEDDDVRLKAVKLLGRLFASTLAEYGVEFSKNFKDFLGRFGDISPSVRLEIIDCAALIIRKKPSLSTEVEIQLVKRLRDSESDVRLMCINRLLEIALEDPKKLCSATFEEMVERVKDKKTDIRLCTIQDADCVSDLIDDEVVPKELWDRLNTIPGALVNCFGYPEMSMRHSIVQLLQEHLLPKYSRGLDDKAASDTPNDTKRATSLLLAFKHMTEPERRAFCAVLYLKLRVRTDVQSYLLERAKPPSEDQEALVRRSLHKLSETLPPQVIDKKTALFEKLQSTKDKHVFRLLETCNSPILSIQESIQTRNELRQRVESKSPLGEYLGLIYDMASYMVVNCGMANALVCYAASAPAHELEIVKYCPHAFSTSANSLKLLLEHSLANAQRSSTYRSHLFSLLGMIEKIAKDKVLMKERENMQTTTSSRKGRKSSVLASQEDNGIEGLFALLLDEAQKERDPIISEQLAVAASMLSDERTEDRVDDVVKSILSRDHLHIKSERLACDLNLLSKFIVSSSHLTAATFSKISSFVTESLLDEDTLRSAKAFRKSSGGLQTPASTACCGLKCWAAMHKAFAQKKTGIETVQQYTDELLNILFGCLASSGSQVGNLSVAIEADRTLFRETAAVALIEMLSISYVAKNISVDQWHSLGWTFLDTNATVREHVVKTFTERIQTSGVHIRYFAYACLVASDERNATKAEQALLFALKRHRCLHEDVIGRAMESEDKKLIALAEDVIPECIVPYALHLLAHIPKTFSKTTEERNKKIVTSIRFVFNALKHSLRNDSDNVAFLLQQIDLLSNRYKDLHDTNGAGLVIVAQMARQLLKESIKTVESVQPYKGNIHMPHELYVFSAQKGGVMTRDEDDVAVSKAVRAVPKANRAVPVQRQQQQQKKRTKAVLTSSESEESDEEPLPVQHESSRPQRGAKSKAISYREMDVSEKEVARWDNVDVENKIKITSRRVEGQKPESVEKKRPLSRISDTTDNSRKTDLDDSNLKKSKTLSIAPKGQRSIQTFLSDFAPGQSQSSEATSAATSTATSSESDRRTSTRRFRAALI